MCDHEKIHSKTYGNNANQDAPIVIKVESLTKTYKLYNSTLDRLKESVHPFGRKYHQLFHAIYDINFEIQKGETNAFVVTDGGNSGFNMVNPNYAADVVSPGNVNKSQLHFSLAGADSGGYLTSVAENNFFISSGAVFNGPAGGWIQKSSDGKSVFFGSGAAGFRAYLNSGATVGGPVTQNQVMLIDYSGNLFMNGGVQTNAAGNTIAKPACDSTKRGLFWLTQGGSGVADTLEVCAKDAAEAYAYRKIW